MFLDPLYQQALNQAVAEALAEIGAQLATKSSRSILHPRCFLAIKSSGTMAVQHRRQATSAGAVVITQGAGSQGEVLGIAVVLLSVVAWGFASVFMRRLTAKYPAVLVTTYGMAISLLFHIPAGIFSAVTQPVNVSPKVVLTILYLGFFGSGFAQFKFGNRLEVI
mgnify:CR=1 FL=1